MKNRKKEINYFVLLFMNFVLIISIFSAIAYFPYAIINDILPFYYYAIFLITLISYLYIYYRGVNNKPIRRRNVLCHRASSLQALWSSGALPISSI